MLLVIGGSFETIAENIKEHWDEIPINRSGMILIRTDGMVYIGNYTKMKTFDGYEAGSIMFHEGTTTNCYIYSYSTKTNTYIFDEFITSEYINTLTNIKYKTADTAFVSYQVGDLIVTLDYQGCPIISGSWALTLAIPSFTPTLIATPVEVSGLNNRELIIPCILCQGSQYGSGNILININGVYIQSNSTFDFIPGASYAITVLFGTGIN